MVQQKYLIKIIDFYAILWCSRLIHSIKLILIHLNSFCNSCFVKDNTKRNQQFTSLITNYLFSASYTVITVLFQFVTLWLRKAPKNQYYQYLLILSTQFLPYRHNNDWIFTEDMWHKFYTVSPCVLLGLVWERT